MSFDRLCGLVVRVPGYSYRDPEFDFLRYQVLLLVMGVEEDALSLSRIIQELRR
jgi:hypothetical protein